MAERTLRQMIFSWAMLRRLTIVGFVLGVVAVVAFIVWFKAITRDIPSPEQLAEYEPPITSRVHAGDGAVIAEFADQHRVFVPYESIPSHVVHAFVSAEDKTFFTHGGIDYKGMARGIFNSVKNKLTNSGGLQGGSTITQQVAKNMLLTRDQTVVRKAKEAEIAWQMEKIFSKEEIMELYLNEIYLGERSYGVGSAALIYFDKSLPELNISEAAVLASLAKAPSTVNPYRRPQRLLQRRNYVLRRMADDGYITQQQADEARAMPLETKRRLRGPEYDAATYFREEVRREIVRDPNYGEDALYKGGLSIRSTIDTRLQLAAQEALQNGLEAYDRRHEYRGPFASIADAGVTADELQKLRLPGGSGDWEGAAVQSVSDEGATLLLEDGATITIPADDVEWAKSYTSDSGATGLQRGDVVLAEVTRKEVTSGEGDDQTITYEPVGEAILRQIPEVDGALIALDPHTGRVLAMAGGYSFYKSQFNRVTQARRQPGSSFKPFVYAAALENGYTPSSRVLDAPYVEFDIEQDDYWTPGNYVKGRWEGLTTMRVGLEKSRNLMTVRMAKDIGLETVSEIGERFDLYDDLPPYTAMSLGAGETSLWRLAKGYAAFVNGGREVTPTLIDRIQKRDGSTDFRHDTRDCSTCQQDEWTGELPPTFEDTRKELIDPITAYQIVNMLEGVVTRGTGRRALRVGKPLAGKTGTTNDYFDALFFGFSPDLVVGVWVGFDSPRTLGDGEAGGSVGAPIFTEFMQSALADEEALPFRIPPGVRLVNIDSKTGQLPGPETAPGDIVIEAFRPGTEPGANFGDDETLNSIFGNTNLFDGPGQRQISIPIDGENGPSILLDADGNPVLDENGNPILIPRTGQEGDPDEEAADGDFGDTY